MWQTLYQIPHEIAGVTVFGWGWALILWLIVCVVVIGSAARHAPLSRALQEWLPFAVMVAVLIIYVLPNVEVDSVDDTIGGGTIGGGPGIAIRGYGVMMGLAIVASVALCIHRAQRRDVPVDRIMSLATWLVIAGILGGRLFYVVQYWSSYQGTDIAEVAWHAVNLTQGGLVVYGSFIGGFVAFVAYARRHRLAFFKLADLIVPSLMLGLAIGRIGCFLNGCCYGGVTDRPWGVCFPRQSVPYEQHLREGRFHGFRARLDDDGRVVVATVTPSGPADQAGLNIGDRILKIQDQLLDDPERWQRVGLSEPGVEASLRLAETLIATAGRRLSVTTPRGRLQWQLDDLPKSTPPIHPTQIYSAITAALVCLFLLAVEPFLVVPGQLFAAWITLYPPLRFLLEVIRQDESSFASTGLTISQNVSLVIFACGIALWFFLNRRKQLN